MILMTGMPEKTSANVLDMYHIIAYIIGPKQQCDNAWKEEQMMMSIAVQQTAAYDLI